MAQTKTMLCIFVMALGMLLIMSTVDAACFGVGWGGCSGSCFDFGPAYYCSNFGRPPNNRCRCTNRFGRSSANHAYQAAVFLVPDESSRTAENERVTSTD